MRICFRGSSADIVFRLYVSPATQTVDWRLLYRMDSYYERIPILNTALGEGDSIYGTTEATEGK